MTVFTLEQELQELVERMLDDTDLASFADVVTRAKAELEQCEAKIERLSMALDLGRIADQCVVDEAIAASTRQLRAELERLKAAPCPFCGARRPFKKE